jgi:hypothetical protein
MSSVPNLAALPSVAGQSIGYQWIKIAQISVRQRTDAAQFRQYGTRPSLLAGGPPAFERTCSWLKSTAFHRNLFRTSSWDGLRPNN